MIQPICVEEIALHELSRCRHSCASAFDKTIDNQNFMAARKQNLRADTSHISGAARKQDFHSLPWHQLDLADSGNPVK
jgi:hypothetical protein